MQKESLGKYTDKDAWKR